MSRQTRTSQMLKKAETRLVGLKEVDPLMDFGDSRSISHMESQMYRLRTRLDDYNRALAVIDTAKGDIEDLEKALGDLMDRMLIGVAFQYGKDSREYQKAGGTRKSDRIRKSSTARIKANKAAQQNQTA